MVSAELLARLELRCRELVRDASRQKCAAGCATARPSGGLNVILSGDLWRGAFLGAIPARMLRSKGCEHEATARSVRPAADLGRAEKWHPRSHRARHVRAHTGRQEEFRHGRLSASTHAFLHGQPTSVPGSWQGQSCKNLEAEHADPARILREECDKCRGEQRSKALVASTDSDPRIEREFHEAASIFATNNVKYHVSAQICSSDATETLLRYRRRSRLSRSSSRKAPSG